MDFKNLDTQPSPLPNKYKDFPAYYADLKAKLLLRQANIDNGIEEFNQTEIMEIPEGHPLTLEALEKEKELYESRYNS